MNKIKHYRKQAGLTQRELALKCGYMDTNSRIGHYENEARGISIEDARTIVKALNEAGQKCTLNDVFPDTEAH